jgi:twitching motility protein PilT
LDIPKLNTDDITNLVYGLISKQQIIRFEKEKELDFGIQYDALNRFRVNVHQQRGFLEAAFRLITTKISSFEELRLPEVIKDLARQKDGLVLIVGPTGSGKTTTIAAMVELINQERRGVIITLERPIEYIHTNIKSIIKQREVGVDTGSFSVALKSSLRQDPNVIVVGELEDTETIKTALLAAEAGYLVIASFHAPDTMQAIDRLASIFPPENRKQVLSQLGNCIRGIIAQLLIPSKDRKKRVLVTEIVIANDAVRRVIRSDELIQLSTIIQTGASYKMQSMYDSIMRCLDEGIVDEEAALFYSKEFSMYKR